MKTIWKIIIAVVLIAASVTGCVLAFNKYKNDEYQRTQTIIPDNPDPEIIDTTGGGNDYQSRIVKAGLKLEALDVDEEMPADFDQQLFDEFENETAYLKLIKYEYPEVSSLGNKSWVSDGMLLKLFLNQELTDPVYFFTKKIHKNAIWGWVPQTAYISYDGASFSKMDRDFKYTNYNFYLKNSQGEVLRIKFLAGTRDTSMYAVFEYYWNQFKASGLVKKTNSYYLNNYFEIARLQDGSFYKSEKNFGMEVEFLNLTKDYWYKDAVVTPSDIYKIFPVEGPKPVVQYLYDQNSFEIVNYAKYSTWNFGTETLTNKFKIYAIDSYGSKNSLTLKNKVNSDYFVASNLVIEKTDFINPSDQTSYGLKFDTAVTELGIRIISLPYSLATPTSNLRYNFVVIQKDAQNNTLATAQSEENVFGQNSTKIFTTSNFYIPFDQNFSILQTTTKIEIQMVGIDTAVFTGMNSVIMLD